MHSKVQQKPPFLRGKQSDPWIKTPLSLELSERSFPFYIPLTPKSDKKTPLLRGEQSKRSFSFYIPLTDYWCTQKCQKTTTFENRVGRSENCVSSLILWWSKRRKSVKNDTRLSFCMIALPLLWRSENTKLSYLFSTRRHLKIYFYLQGVPKNGWCLLTHRGYQKWTKDKNRVSFAILRLFPF